jgi:hypothetical protein
VGNKAPFSLLDQFHASFYELDNDDTSLLFVGRNPAILGIWHDNCDRTSQACRPIRIKAKDEQNRFFIVERIRLAISDIEWQTKSNELAIQDQVVIDELVKFISWLSKNFQYTPAKLHTDLLFLHEAEHSVSLRVVLPFDSSEPHNFAAIEQFVTDCAKGNAWVFRYLMHKSGLVDHQTACQVRFITQSKLHEYNLAVSVQDMLNREKISDCVFIARVEQMIASLKERAKTIYFRLKPKCSSDILEQTIVESLLAYQKEGGCVSSVPQELYKQITLAAFEQQVLSKLLI